jgi:phasin family protein
MCLFLKEFAMLTVDQIVAAQKAQVAALFDLSSKALASVEKLTELNLQATKATLSETASTAQAALGVKDVQELLALQASVMQPLAEKAASYSRHLYDIASGATAEFSKVAEAQAADVQKKFVAAVDTAVKSAPQGSESAVAAVKNAVSTASAAMESVQKAVKQATDLAEANFNAVTSTALNAGKQAAKARA